MKAKRLIVLLSCFILAACAFACGKESKLTISAETLSVEAGSNAELTASIDDGSDLVWSSDDTDVAYWSDGRVYGVSEGTAVITVTAGDKSASCTVTVTAKASETPVTRVIALSASSLDIEPGGSDTLTATVYEGGPATKETVTWTGRGRLPVDHCRRQHRHRHRRVRRSGQSDGGVRGSFRLVHGHRGRHAHRVRHARNQRGR